MAPDVLEKLQARSPAIRERWETLLRGEPVSGPLANPDAMVHLIPETLERVFAALARKSRAPLSIRAARSVVPDCECGNNPYRAYFIAGEQALCEAAVLLQAEQPASDRRQSDLAEILYTVRRLARADIDAFCGICVHRGVAAHCRHAAAAR